MKVTLPAPATAFNYAALTAATAAELHHEAKRIRAWVKTSTAGIIEIGKTLIAVKQKLEHGQFSEWVSAECGFSTRTAENYIRAAEFAAGCHLQDRRQEHAAGLGAGSNGTARKRHAREHH